MAQLESPSGLPITTGKFLRSPKDLEKIFRNLGFDLKIEVKTKQFRIPLDTVEITARPN